MKWLVMGLLTVVGIGGIGYIADKTLVLFLMSCCEFDYDMSNPAANLFPYWQLKSPHFRKPCFGLCPEIEMER
jgi:hypothetical protein